METKLIVFDLDGVLIDSKTIHFDALNQALTEVDVEYVISAEEQETTYEGLTTRDKLDLLTKNKELPEELHDDVWSSKQLHTTELFKSIEVDEELVELFKQLKSDRLKIAIASNSTRATVDTCIIGLGLWPYVNLSLSNEDVANPKPSPEIYLKCMERLEASPEETVIFEDSVVGQEAATRSRATLIPVVDRVDLIQNKAKLIMSKAEASDKTINVLIPMAGEGTRFTEAGYDLPKPLIDVKGVPMIQAVVEDLDIEGNYIFVVQKEHYEQYGLEELLTKIKPGCQIIQLNGTTDGATTTTLAAKELIDNGSPLVIANSDQLLNWDSEEFFKELEKEPVHGAIVVFKANKPKWSYVKLNSQNHVTKVAEKEVISQMATAGVYYWTEGSDYVKYAEQMIAKDVRTNGEFYVCPVYNEALLDNAKVVPFSIDSMVGLGTPEDLEKHLND